MEKARILLAEDHALVRAGIKSLLENLLHVEVEVVAEAGDGEEALRLARQHQPDIVLMDISMSGMNGLQAAAHLRQELPTIRVIMLSMYETEVYVFQALRAGASGYLLKNADPEELERAIKTIMKGDIYLTPAVSKYLVKYLAEDSSGRGGAGNSSSDTHDAGVCANGPEQLTPRQREILKLIATGHSTQQIAKLLFIGVKTVETHRAQLMERLNIHDVAGLTLYAIRKGLVNSE